MIAGCCMYEVFLLTEEQNLVQWGEESGWNDAISSIQAYGNIFPFEFSISSHISSTPATTNDSKQNLSGRKRLYLCMPGLRLFYIKSSIFAFLQQIQGPPDYTDSGRVTPQNEPFDLSRQEYSVIQPVLPNPSEKNWEIPRESLVFVKVIGKGAFGQVAKGMATGIDNSKESRLVAIKMLKGAMLDRVEFLICVYICLWHPSFAG